MFHPFLAGRTNKTVIRGDMNDPDQTPKQPKAVAEASPDILWRLAHWSPLEWQKIRSSPEPWRRIQKDRATYEVLKSKYSKEEIDRIFKVRKKVFPESDFPIVDKHKTDTSCTKEIKESTWSERDMEDNAERCIWRFLSAIFKVPK